MVRVFRKAKFENLRASRNIIRYIKENPEEFDLSNLVVLPCDLNGAKRVEHYASMLGVDLAFTYKKRDYSIPNSVAESKFLGGIKGKDALVIDDMIDTSGSMLKTIELIKEEKGAKRV